MSLIFSEEFTGATSVGDTDFDSLSGGMTFGSNIMTLNKGGAWAPSYVVLDSALSSFIGTRQKALHMQFDVRVDDATFNANKFVDLLRLFRGSTLALQFQYRAIGSNEANAFRLVYDDLVNGANHIVEGNTFTVSDNTWHTIELRLIMSLNDYTADGSLEVWFDDSKIIDEQNIGTTDVWFDEIRFGANNVTITGGTTSIDFDNVYIGSNRTFVSQAETFYVDSEGARTALGTVSATSGALDIITDYWQPGDTIILVNNGVSSPLRSVRDAGNGHFLPFRSGTSDSLVKLTSDTGKTIITNTINATEGGAFSWSGPDANGEYHLTTAASGDPQFPQKPNFIAKCSAADWTSGGVNNLDATASEGTAGSLALGEWDYASNGSFNTIFYKPEAGENMATLHFEIPHGNQSNKSDSAMVFDIDYYMAYNFEVMFALNHGVEQPPNSGAGAFLFYVNASKCWMRGFQDNSACTTGFLKSENNLAPGEAGGFLINNGASGTKYAPYAANNSDDGFEVGCSLGTTIDVTIIAPIAYNNGSGSTDGFGFEVGMGAAGQTVRIYNAIADGNDKGINIAMDLASTVIVQNAVAINNTVYGIDDGSTAGTTTYATNHFYNNGTNTNGANYDNNGDTTGDPLITIDTDEGIYTVASNSPLIGGGTKWWGNNPRPTSRTGEPYPDTNLDLGAIQTTYDSNHPVNL